MNNYTSFIVTPTKTILHLSTVGILTLHGILKLHISTCFFSNISLFPTCTLCFLFTHTHTHTHIHCKINSQLFEVCFHSASNAVTCHLQINMPLYRPAPFIHLEFCTNISNFSFQLSYTPIYKDINLFNTVTYYVGVMALKFNISICISVRYVSEI